MKEQYRDMHIPQIIEEVQRDIKSRNIQNVPVSFQDIKVYVHKTAPEPEAAASTDLVEWNSNVDEMLQACEINLDTPLTRKSRKLGALEITVKKVLKKSLRFILWPLVTGQNYFNKVTAQSMSQTRNIIMNMNEKDYESQIRLLKEQVRELERRLQAVESGKDKE